MEAEPAGLPWAVFGERFRDGLGWSVAGAGPVTLGSPDEFEEILLGAPGYGETLYPGRVQVYSARIGANYCVGATNSVGLSGRIAALGSTSVSSGTFVLRAADVTPNKPGIFYYGPLQTQLPLGDGFRCIGGSLTRLQPTLVTNGAGMIALGVDLSAEPMHSDIALMAPLTMNFQFWHRDDVATSNLTDAVAVDFLP